MHKPRRENHERKKVAHTLPHSHRIDAFLLQAFHIIDLNGIVYKFHREDSVAGKVPFDFRDVDPSVACKEGGDAFGVGGL